MLHVQHGFYRTDSCGTLHKGPVIRASFSFNLSRNTVALQVETLCCAYYRVRDQLVSQQNIVLQVEASCCEKSNRLLLSAANSSFVARITTEVQLASQQV